VHPYLLPIALPFHLKAIEPVRSSSNTFFISTSSVPIYPSHPTPLLLIRLRNLRCPTPLKPDTTFERFRIEIPRLIPVLVPAPDSGARRVVVVRDIPVHEERVVGGVREFALTVKGGVVIEAIFCACRLLMSGVQFSGIG